MSISSLNLNGLQGVSPSQVSGMDIETALLAIQNQRAGLLEGQLQSQLQDVQDRNAQIGKLNDVLGGARTLSAQFTSDAQGTDQLPEGTQLEAFKKAAGAAGVDIRTVVDKSTLGAAVENFKSLIDSQSNSQQMDMLRLQSLSNKRNEAFDVMTNFIKKMQDSRSSIIGNMR
ncbi:hypothetical protein [Acidovorax sp. CCYZU-2555]|uniref:hypothetical protein n=1 Tax=Acidovorax sp. CCYZU-2555 TaxID=2835042 RepID=UPI001BCF0C44|nr:hypothetical protein [Acidovorax sp. CCYZU-2555]MBS7777598.1 hypothetical protein [Acidovorax sp. CCYZU-2555]